MDENKKKEIDLKDGRHHLSVHIMQLLVALDAEVLVTKHFNPAAFGVLVFSVLVITMRLLFCFLHYGILVWIWWLWRFLGLLLSRKHMTKETLEMLDFSSIVISTSLFWIATWCFAW